MERTLSKSLKTSLAMARKTDNYPLFVHWSDSLDWILTTCDRIPKAQRFTLANRIATHSLDVAELIAEAIYTKERRPILKHINLKLEKLRILFRICHSRRYISTRQYAYIAARIDESGRMCGGWMKK
jgi:hypothetical protein